MINNPFLFQALLTVVALTTTWITAAWMTNRKLTITTLSNYDVYEFGEEISFNCTGQNAELIRIQVNNNDIPSNMTIVLGAKVLSSTVPINKHYFEIGYNSINCFEGDKSFTSKHIDVEDNLVHDVNDIMCIIDRAEDSLKCNWTIGIYHFTKYINATFSVRGSGSDTWISCNPSISITQSCSFKDFNTSSVLSYLKLEVTNTERNISKTFEKVNLTQPSLVKPEMVKNVKVLNVTSRATLIEWSLPKEVNTLFVRLNISSMLDKQRTIEIEQVKHFLLENLKPFTKYWISIDNRLEGGQYYSDTVSISFTTNSDVPENPPYTYPGGFYIKNGACAVHSPGKLRNITVYWKSIQEEYRNGPNFKYMLSANSSSGRRFQIEIDGNQTSVGVSLECDLSYDIKVKAGTTSGFSNYSTLLRVPEHKASSGRGRLNRKRRLVGTHTHTQMHSQASYCLPKDITPIRKLVVQTPRSMSFVNITWQHNVKIASYIVLWCIRSPDNSECDGEVQSNRAPINDTRQLILRSDVTGPISLLRFGVTGVSGPSAHYSSGITWETCRYQLDQAPAVPDGLNMAAESPYKSLAIMWSAPKCDWQSGYVHKYRVRYCLLKDSNPPVCKERGFLPQKVAEYTLEGLTAFEKYSLQLQAVSPLGKKSLYTAPLYGVPDSNELKVHEKVIIVLVSVVCVIIGTTLCVLWLKLNMRKRPYAVEIPVISGKISNHVENQDSHLNYYETTESPVPETFDSQTVQTIQTKARHGRDDSGNGSFDSDSLRRESLIRPGKEGNSNYGDDCPKLSEDNSGDLSKVKIAFDKLTSDQASLLDNNGYILQDKICEVSRNVNHVILEKIEEDSGEGNVFPNRIEGNDKKKDDYSTELPADYVRATLEN